MKADAKDRLTEYRRAELVGMSQAELVVMLYQGAIRYLHEAVAMLEAERYDQSWRHFDRSRKIVVHLYGTLNQEAGDLSEKLGALYRFVIEQITHANMRRDPQLARDCIGILTTLKEGWEGIAAAPPVETGLLPGQTAVPARAVEAGTLCCEA